MKVIVLKYHNDNCYSSYIKDFLTNYGGLINSFLVNTLLENSSEFDKTINKLIEEVEDCDTITHNIISNLVFIEMYTIENNLKYFDGIALNFINNLDKYFDDENINFFPILIDIFTFIISKLIAEKIINNLFNISSPNVSPPNVSSPNVSSPNVSSPNVLTVNVDNVLEYMAKMNGTFEDLKTMYNKFLTSELNPFNITTITNDEIKSLDEFNIKYELNKNIEPSLENLYTVYRIIKHREIDFLNKFTKEANDILSSSDYKATCSLHNIPIKTEPIIENDITSLFKTFEKIITNKDDKNTKIMNNFLSFCGSKNTVEDKDMIFVNNIVEKINGITKSKNDDKSKNDESISNVEETIKYKSDKLPFKDVTKNILKGMEIYCRSAKYHPKILQKIFSDLYRSEVKEPIKSEVKEQIKSEVKELIDNKDFMVNHIEKLIKDMGGIINKPVNIEPVNIEPVNIEPVNIDPVNIEPVNIEPVKTDMEYLLDNIKKLSIAMNK
jgi:hypothetical protein